MAPKVYVVVDTERCDPPPRIKAMIMRLLRDSEEICRMTTGKVVFNMGGKSITPVYEKVGEPLDVA